MEENKAKRERNVTPRTETHQAVLDAVHVWCKAPFAENREAVLKAMLTHKRAKYGDENITAL
jgi:hypothetical protein